MRVALAVVKQAPAQHRELARRGDDRLAVTAASLDPLVEGAQRSGLVTMLQASTSAQRAEADPRFEIRPSGRVARRNCLTLGSRPR